MTERKPFRFRGIGLRARENLYGYGFILLWLIGFAVFTVVPLAQTFFFSLNQVTVTATGIDLLPVQWANYTRALVTDPNFVELLIEYAIETLVSVPIVIIFSMIIAMFLNLKFRFKGFFRTGLFLPTITALVAYALVFKLLLNTDHGLINYLLESVHLPPVISASKRLAC